MNSYYTPLEQESLLHIAGPDTLKFLQGQTTCDTRKVDAGHAVPGALCTPQGRVVCDFLLFEVAPEQFALRMRRDIRANSAAVFGKYIIFSKAKIDASNEDWIPVAVWGPAASAILTEVFGGAPSARFDTCAAEDFVLVQADEAGEQFECFLKRASSADHLSRIAAMASESTEAHWQAQQIASGIARIEAATVEAFVPQVLNYDLTGHISFKKGCYTGQEVVARLHYRGKSKRRAHAAELADNIACAAGETVYDAVSGQGAGHIINCAHAAGKTQALLTATEDGLANGLRLGAIDGPALTVLELPYPLPSSQ